MQNTKALTDRRLLCLIFTLAPGFMYGQQPMSGRSGVPEQFSQDRYVQRAVWVPYWSELGDEHSTLHVRNALHHLSLSATLDVLDSTGGVINSFTILVDKVSNLEFPMAFLVPSGAPATKHSGAIRITYSYPYDGVLQAEVSVRDDSANRGFTIVGRPAYQSAEKAAYLAVHVPTPDTYLEAAFANSTSAPVNVQLSMRQAAGWKEVAIISLAASANQKVRITAKTLNDPEFLASTRVALLKVDYSVSSTEIVSNAWLADESSGFSNTALFQDEYPKTNTLFGAQLVSGTFPANALPNSPSLDSWLVFVNINDAPVDLSGDLYCDDGGGPKRVKISPRQLLPYSPQSISLAELLFPGAATPQPEMCNAVFEYAGTPGHVVGRFYGVSQSKAYGMYSKLEPFVTRGYNEVYWSVEDDFVPVVTVANFSERDDTFSVYVSVLGQLQKLTSANVAGHGSLTLNMRDQIASLRSQGGFPADYGGLYISSERASGKLMVKQQAISPRRLMMVPYYGAPDYVSVNDVVYPGFPSTITLGSTSNVNTYVCLTVSGCFYYNSGPITSSNSSVISVSGGGYTGAPPQVMSADSAGDSDLDVYPECCGYFGELVYAQGARNVQVGPILLTCTPNPVTRASSVTCTVSGATAGSISQWQFSGNAGNVSGPSATTTWSGTMVQSGTVSVNFTGGATSTNVTVNPRTGFTGGMPAPTKVANGTAGLPALPTPPYSGNGILGYSGFFYSFSRSTATINSGPNNGFSYVSTYSPTVTYPYEINPDLDNASSTFAQKQYGNCGIISYATLLAYVVNHESGATNSHYAQAKAQMDGDNPGTFAEQMVTGSGSTPGTGAINDKFIAVVAAGAPEPPGSIPGTVNYPTYSTCP